LKYWIIVPAAGRGLRFGSDAPKQYCALAGRTVIELSLERMMVLSGTVLVALREGDERWRELEGFSGPRVRRVAGGVRRMDSVLSALEALEGEAGEDDWALVHDAARPCVRAGDLEHLVDILNDHPVGGILASPLTATLKQIDPAVVGEAGMRAAGEVRQTLPRDNLWLAQTPQMFRYGLLRTALQTCRNAGVDATDEAAAIEYMGYAPAVVAGSNDNLKITSAEDLELAEIILQAQRNS